MTEYICIYDEDEGQYIQNPYEDKTVLTRCKDCKYYRDGDCWHEWDYDGKIYYQSVIIEPDPEDYCSYAERKAE